MSTQIACSQILRHSFLLVDVTPINYNYQKYFYAVFIFNSSNYIVKTIFLPDGRLYFLDTAIDVLTNSDRYTNTGNTANVHYIHKNTRKSVDISVIK